MIVVYQYQGQTVTLEWAQGPGGALTARIGERVYPVEAQPLPDGGWRLVVAGKPALAYTAAHGAQRFVSLGGATYVLSVNEGRGGPRRKSSAGGGDLIAAMPGQVIDVRVSVNDPVTRGQTLVILEAMKMEIRVAAPHDGHVKRLLVHTGAVVERGQLLLEIEADSAAGPS